MDEFKLKISKEIEKLTGLKKDQIVVEIPPDHTMGDYAFPCFVLSKELKKNPAEIAKELVGKVKTGKLVKEAKAAGPYLNFFVNKEEVAGTVLNQILKEKDKFGVNNSGKGSKVMVEYSSPNTNKPLHLGHLRNDSIGMSISKILEANGYKVVKAILYSNRGIAMCKAMIAYEKWGKGKKPDKKSDHFVGDYYVMFEKKKTAKLDEEALEMLKKWEAKDPAVRKLWEKIEKWALDGYKETYKRFGSEFDVEFKESDLYDKSKPIIEEGLKKGVFYKEEDNSIQADLQEEGLGNKVILRSDGTSIYVTNDLMLTKLKFDKYKIDKSLWIVGSEHNLYFRQLFKIFEKLGYKWHKDCVHVSYGLVYLPEGKMKSREGTVVDADNIIQEMVDLAGKEIKKRDKELSDKEVSKRAEQIALGALKFFLLKADTIKDINFDPAETIDFEGDTGPYIQYSHARVCSILRNFEGKVNTKADLSLLKEPVEQKLVKVLGDFPAAVEKAGRNYKVHIIANYLLDLSHSFNEFYHGCQILKEEDDLRDARLLLALCCKQVLENGLSLLGVPAPERM